MKRSEYIVAIMAVILATSVMGQAAIVITSEQLKGPGVYAGDASSIDLINDGQETLLSETHSIAPQFGKEGLNDGVADGKDSTKNAYFKNTQLPSTLTFTLNTSVNARGYDITNVTTISGWKNNSLTLANQTYELWIRKVGSTEFTLLHTVSYIPFTTSGPTATTKVSLNDDSGVMASGVDAVRFVLLDDGVNSGVPGNVYQEIDVKGSPTVK